jgi:hypothetical protein
MLVLPMCCSAAFVQWVKVATVTGMDGSGARSGFVAN